MGPDVKTVNNAATPVAEDFVAYLQGLMSQGGGAQSVGPQQSNRGSTNRNRSNAMGKRGYKGQAGVSGGGGGSVNPNFGSGVGAANQNAIAALTALVSGGANRVASGGVDPGTLAMIAALTADSNVQTNRQAGDLREAFGAAGARYGTSLGSSEAILRGESSRGLNANIANILMGRQAQNETNYLSAIQELGNQGQNALLPYLALLQLGTAPAENIASPGLGSQLITGATAGAASYFGAKK